LLQPAERETLIRGLLDTWSKRQCRNLIDEKLVMDEGFCCWAANANQKKPEPGPWGALLQEAKEGLDILIPQEVYECLSQNHAANLVRTLVKKRQNPEAEPADPDIHFGDEEFIQANKDILAPEVARELAYKKRRQVCKKIREATKQSFAYNPGAYNMTKFGNDENEEDNENGDGNGTEQMEIKMETQQPATMGGTTF